MTNVTLITAVNIALRVVPLVASMMLIVLTIQEVHIIVLPLQTLCLLAVTVITAREPVQALVRALGLEPAQRLRQQRQP